MGLGWGVVDSSAQDKLVEVIGCWPRAQRLSEALAVLGKEEREIEIGG